MLNFIKKMFGYNINECCHEWDKWKKGRIDTDYYSDWDGKFMYTAWRSIQIRECKKCGLIQKKEF